MARDRGFQVLACLFTFCASGSLKQTVDFTADKMMPVTEGDRVRFTCAITGNPALVIFSQTAKINPIVTWRINDGACSVWGPIEDDDTTMYTSTCNWSISTVYLDILNVTADFHDVNVTCKVFVGDDASDTVDGFVAMGVNAPLQWVDISEDEIILQEYRDINVSCMARSRQLPEITWFISGRQLHDNLTSVSYNDIEVNSTVHYTGNRSDNHGMLSCRADNTVKDLVSSILSLNITYPPDISVFPHGLPIEGSKEYNVSCLILGSNPNVCSFNWLIDSETVDQTSNVLTLRHLNRSDTNNYTCIATNGIGQPSISTLFIDVLYKGTILLFSHSISSINDGEMFIADVKAEGKPLPNVTWSYDRTNTRLLTEHDTEASTLNITRRCEDTRNYTCTVDNGILYPDTEHFILIISCEPRAESIIDIENNVVISVGGTLRLEATFVAFPQPNITWYFQSNNLTASSTISTDHYVIFSDEAMHVTTLSIQQVNATYNGQFIVTAENVLGQDKSVFSVNIIDSDESKAVSVEAIVGGVAGTVIFIILVALVFKCYRKNKNKALEDEPAVEPIESMYCNSPGYITSSQRTRVEVSEQRIYANVSRLSIKQSNGLEIKIADNYINTSIT